MLLFPLPIAWMSIKLAGQFIVPAPERKIWSYKIKQSSQLCVSFPDRSEMTQKDRPKKNVFVFAKVALGKLSRSYTIGNQKFCQTLQLDFNFGFGSRNSKSSRRRVPRETRATELFVP